MGPPTDVVLAIMARNTVDASDLREALHRLTSLSHADIRATYGVFLPGGVPTFRRLVTPRLEIIFLLDHTAVRVMRIVVEDSSGDDSDSESFR